MKAWTDYPFEQLGDEPYKEAPVREVKIISYDGNKYCKVKIKGFRYALEVKSGYLYQTEGRYREVEFVTQKQLSAINSPSNPIVVSFKKEK